MYYEEEDSYTSVKQDAVGEGLCERPMFNRRKGFNTNTGLERLFQSMKNILQTPIGTRFFLPTFGSRLTELIFEPNVFILADLARMYTREAIEKWEPRVTIVDILTDTETDPLVCAISIKFTLKGDSNIQTYSYPLRRRES